ncbi:MAG: transglycosylase domain-containing protein [Pseudobdellovibrionaceae bacterium]
MALTICFHPRKVKPLMKKLKPFLWALAILSCLVIAVGSALLYRFNQRIQEGLAQKRFLPPTEYYSATLDFSVDSSLLREDFKKILATRQYRQRDWEQKLFPGDYSENSIENCRGSLPAEFSAPSQTCLLFSVKETSDPELAQFPLQMAVFDSEDKLVATFQGNPLQTSAKISLEPELVAQYLDGQPIMQSYKALGEIPTVCLNAVLAIEDSKFLEHSGFSFTGLARAFVANVFGGRFRQGGSTITQQLVKNYFLTSEKTLKRKLTELAMSVLLEAHSSKDEILETYLNVIYLGQNGPFQVRGYGAASQYYFNKPLEQLDLPQCSLMAAILNSPGLFDPFRKQENALKRRSLVLDRMTDLQMISKEEADQAKQVPLPFEKRITVTETAPYYLNAVSKEVEDMGLDLMGLKIFTGLSLKEQQAAQEAVRNSLSDLEVKNAKIKALKEKGLTLEGALLSAHNDTGLISAIVGGRSYKLTQFNRAVDGHRQIGSIMKPFVYLTALLNSDEDKKIYDPMTILNDERFSHKYEGQTWTPENYGKKYYGQVPMVFALKNSLNAATVSLGLEVGVPKVIDTAKALGIQSEFKPVPSALLGSFELYPIEVLESYTSLARMGNHIQLSTLRGITDLKGQKIYLREVQSEQALPAEDVAVLVGMMKQTTLSGTARAISLSGFATPAAGKTGTTSDNKDAWFAGFTANQTTVVWVGYDNPTAHGLTGASGAVPLWIQFMKKVTPQNSTQDFPWPEKTEHKNVQVEEPETGSVEMDLIFKD